jgi:hypothetical protein
VNLDGAMIAGLCGHRVERRFHYADFVHFG